MSTDYLNCLEFFDEEYAKLNNSIENLNSLFVQTKDDYNKLNFILHNLIQSISTQSLDYDSFNNSIKLIKDFIQNVEDFSTSAKHLYDSVIFITQNDTKKIEAI